MLRHNQHAVMDFVVLPHEPHRWRQELVLMEFFFFYCHSLDLRDMSERDPLLFKLELHSVETLLWCNISYL